MEPKLLIITTLTKAYQSDELIGAIVKLFLMKNQHLALLTHLLHLEIVNTGEFHLLFWKNKLFSLPTFHLESENTLLRTDSVATKSVRAFLRAVASDYLSALVTPLIRLVIANNDVVEVLHHFQFFQISLFIQFFFSLG